MYKSGILLAVSGTHQVSTESLRLSSQIVMTFEAIRLTRVTTGINRGGELFALPYSFGTGVCGFHGWNCGLGGGL